MEENKSATNAITCARVNPDIFESDDVAKSCLVSYRTINQYGGTTCKFGATIARAMAHALMTFYCRGTLGTRVNPDIIGYMWTGEFDWKTLRVDGKIFESGKKKVRIKNYPHTCGWGLNILLGRHLAWLLWSRSCLPLSLLYIYLFFRLYLLLLLLFVFLLFCFVLLFFFFFFFF